ncbi:leucine-rich repeat domain-containing protein, partial [Adlercreutzia sp. ZJ154]|uniref:leucine-rich repeat domain-containing protein n=1 Tax=Adlercreutzia sp. ZJ154 TaxID=2709790 RepID=UPI0013ED3670
AEGAFWGNESLATIVSDGKVKAIEAGVSSQIEGTYDIYPAFAGAVVQGATVALRVSADEHDAAKAAWEAVGFCNFADPATPGQVESPEENESGFTFTLQDDYTLAVGWAGEDIPSAVVIPDAGVVAGMEYTVSTIAGGAFDGLANLEAVYIPDTVKTIGKRAFANTNLSNFVVPAQLQVIDDEAFANIDGITIVDARGTAAVAANALDGTTNAHVYAPYNEANEYAWKTGVPATGNTFHPFGVKLSSDTFDICVGDTVSLFNGEGYIYATGDVYPVVTYPAKSFSIDVDAGTITALSEGNMRFHISLAIDIDRLQPDGSISSETLTLLEP